jgi:Ca-activated chloride channel family protein
MRSRPIALLPLFLAAAALGQWDSPRPIPPRPIPPRPQPERVVVVEATDIEFEARDGATRIRIRQTLFNPSGQTQEAWLHLPLPKGSRVHDASLKLGDEWIEAEILDDAQARRAYEDIVRRCIDPALIEYVDENLLRARVWPVAAHERRQIELRLELLLPLEFDAWSLRLPLRALAQSGRIELAGEIESSSAALQRPYSPTHAIDAELDGSRRATVRWSAEHAESDMQLLLPLSPARMSTLAQSSKPAGEDGYLLLRIAPGSELRDTTPLPKDLLLVVDQSGSMRGEKLAQAKAALTNLVEGLRDGDRFAILAYSSEVWPLTEGLVANSAAARREALRTIEELEADGGTNIEAALDAALALLAEGGRARARYLLFVTDGLPTVGEQDVTRLLDRLRRRGDALPRLFAFGVGHDVNTTLLDGIAREGRALARYVLPGENLEIALSQLGAQIEEPVWTDLELESDGRLHGLQPAQLGDLFAGQAITLFARYDRPGNATLTLRGRRAGQAVSHRFELRLESGYGKARYLPRLWAAQRIAELERSLRDDPHDKRAQDEILELAIRHGIVTRQTSLLMREPDARLAQAMRDGDWQGAREQAASKDAREERIAFAPKPASGAEAVDRAAKLSRANEAPTLEASLDAVDAEHLGLVSGLKRLGGRVFERRGEVYVDRLAEGAKVRLRIAPFSDAWWEVLTLRPDLRTMLANGELVQIALDGEVLSIEQGGVTQLSAAAREWLRTARL